MYEDHKLDTNFLPCLQVGPSIEGQGVWPRSLSSARGLTGHLWPQVHYVEREGIKVVSEIKSSISESGCWVAP